MALGVIPIAVTEVHAGAAYEAEVADAANLGPWDLEPEVVMVLEPDLILLASDTQYGDMSKIAPTVLVPYGDMTAQERLAFLGEVLGRLDEAQAAFATYESAVSDGRARLMEAGLSGIAVSAMQVTDDGSFVVGDKHALGSVLYKELGLRAPDAVQSGIIDAGEYWGTPSMEVLAGYCGDYVFHLGEIAPSISANAVWRSIPAVSGGKVMVINTALTYYTDISSSIAMVNNVVDQLIDASSK